MHLELPIGAFVAAFLVLIPLPWHWRARNVPTLSIIAWLFISNLIYGVNAIVWAGNVDIVIPVWCDIVTKLQIGATMALPTSCLCLCMHLERIASIRQVNTSLQQKHRRMLLDALMCWGIPVIYMALHYIVQGHRFDIVEDLGCRPAIYNSLQSIFLVWVPPLIVIALIFVFAGLALYHFFQRRLTFARHLQGSNSALTASRYFRLMAMAIVQMFWGAVVIGFNMWFTCRKGLRPWTGWADVHYNFSRVGLFPTLLFPPEVLRWTYFAWWTIPISSGLFFIFFAFGQDAVKEYGACFAWVRSKTFRHLGDEKVSSALRPALRTPITRGALPKFSHLESSCGDSTFSHTSTRRGSMDKDSSFVLTPVSVSSFASNELTITSFAHDSTNMASSAEEHV